MSPRPTRTIGPLHFEDLDPHRFEDLVRALLYDFRPWLKLEGTGRGGGDDGFDVRGWEGRPQTVSNVPEPEDNDGNETVDFLADARLWLIQCKRERAIGPKKLKEYLDSIPVDQRVELDAVLFVAACDFTKKTRDTFREWCVEGGISEYHLWGKSELEDELLQPRNDGLLFAFFGISLVVRRRSIKTELRARLATKRKITKLVGQIGRNVHRTCLFRDPADGRYPEVPEGIALNPAPMKFGYNWFVRAITEVRHDGILIKWRERLAYLADDGVHWDAIKQLGDQAIPGRNDNPWEHSDDFETEVRKTRNARAFWTALPHENRAIMNVEAFIPFDAILAIDEEGDGITRLPTIFVSFDANYGPFASGSGVIESAARDQWTHTDSEKMIEFFPAEFPEPPSESAQLVDDEQNEIRPDER
ncbi:MAG TPA: hypothetical protein VII56_09995 [Rhizomicrobium sp.]